MNRKNSLENRTTGEVFKPKMDRRSFLKGMVTAIGASTAAVVLTACGDDTTDSAGPWDLNENPEMCRRPELCHAQRIRCSLAEEFPEYYEEPEYCDGHEEPLTREQMYECTNHERNNTEGPDYCKDW